MNSTIFEKYGFRCSRMVSGSKSFYRTQFPKNEVYFNCNIYTAEDGKLWWGDIDYTLDRGKLVSIATEFNKVLYILSEMDGRFENEKRYTRPQLEELAQKTIYPWIQ